MLREAIASYEAHLKDATNLLEVGMAARNDVLAVQVERDGAELSRLQAESAAEVENANLVRLLDLPPGTRVSPAEDGVDPGLGTEGRDLAEVEGFVAEALQQRSEVLALQSRVAAASAQAKVARAPSRPQASLQGMYDYANPNQRIFPLEGTWRDTWAVAVGVSFTPFDGGRSSAAAARAEAQAEAAGHQLRDLQQRVRLEVTSRFLELRSARASLEVATRNVTAAQENVRVSQDRYRAGRQPLLGPARRRDPSPARGPRTDPGRGQPAGGAGAPRTRPRALTDARHRGRPAGEALRRLRGGGRPQLRRWRPARSSASWAATGRERARPSA